MQNPGKSNVVNLSQNGFCARTTCAVTDSKLTDRSAAVKTIAAPRYSPEALGQNIGGLAIDPTPLPSNDVQEILFRLKQSAIASAPLPYHRLGPLFIADANARTMRPISMNTTAAMPA